MEVATIDKGMIYFLNDLNREGEHPYIVIADGDNNNLGYVQCMAITSMTGKTVTWEVPIKLNDKISYIVPQAIHSFNKKDFSLRKLAGVIKDGEMRKEDFLKLLTDIFSCSLIGNYSSVESRYIDYTTEFKVNNKTTPELRSNKELARYGAVIASTNKIYHQPASLKTDETVRKPLTQNINTAIEKEERSEKKLPEVEEKKDTKQIRSYSPHIPLEVYKEFETLCSTPRFVASWDSNNLKLFMKLYRNYPIKDVIDITNMRWKTESGVISTFNSVEKEARKRGLSTMSKYDKYSNEHIEIMLEQYERQKDQKSKLPALYQMFSCSNKQDLVREVYNFRKELKRRKKKVK